MQEQLILYFFLTSPESTWALERPLWLISRSRSQHDNIVLVKTSLSGQISALCSRSQHCAVPGTAAHENTAGFTLLYRRNGSLRMTNLVCEWHRPDRILAGLGDKTPSKWKGPEGVSSGDKWHLLMAVTAPEGRQLHSCVRIRTAAKPDGLRSWSSIKRG